MPAAYNYTLFSAIMHNGSHVTFENYGTGALVDWDVYVGETILSPLLHSNELASPKLAHLLRFFVLSRRREGLLFQEWRMRPTARET